MACQHRRLVSIAAGNWLSEATTNRFVAENTASVPVLEVALALLHDGWSYTFPRYPDGQGFLTSQGMLTLGGRGCEYKSSHDMRKPS